MTPQIYILYDSVYAGHSVVGHFGGLNNGRILEFARAELISLSGSFSVALVHVKGHAGNIYNECADKLAEK
eukprot:405511-Karenia_brevis.AAC.1